MARQKLITTPERSRNMAAIRSRGNASTEHAMVKLLRESGIKGWRRHLPILLPASIANGWKRSSVRPDFVFPHSKVAVFVDGDFWHGNPKLFRLPASNTDFWTEKIERNRKRDKAVDRRLRAKAWKVVRVWESGLKKRPGHCAARVMKALAPD